jgi:HK97 family phage portal protein
MSLPIVSRVASALGFVRKEAVPRAFEQPLGTGGWFGWTIGGRPETDFQRDIRWTRDGILANQVVFACITLIASDIGKVCLKLVEKKGKIWVDAESAAFSPVLRKPNGYQTRQQFLESWVTSKLAHGNTYVLKGRDAGGIVRQLYILNPCRVRVLVSESGDVFYELQPDDLAQVPEDELVRVPASEIIHDRMVCLFHDLVGTSPLFAAGLPASQALEIQRNSSRFFRNGSRPGTVLSAPGQISDTTAKRLKDYWEQEFTGENIGRVAVLGDDLKPVALAVNPDVAQLVEQLKLSAEMICAAFHVPGFKVGVGTAPTYQNAGVLNQVYYSDCLQKMTEAIENLLDEGLGLLEKKEGHQYGTMFDLDDLLKMDPGAYATTLKTLIDAAVMAPNEARERWNLPPVAGGASPMIQQQNYSLAAIDKRDTSEDPFAKAPPPAPPAPPPAAEPPPPDAGKSAEALTKALISRLRAEVESE